MLLEQTLANIKAIPEDRRQDFINEIKRLFPIMLDLIANAGLLIDDDIYLHVFDGKRMGRDEEYEQEMRESYHYATSSRCLQLIEVVDNLFESLSASSERLPIRDSWIAHPELAESPLLL